jgi:hypothetical protein
MCALMFATPGGAVVKKQTNVKEYRIHCCKLAPTFFMTPKTYVRSATVDPYIFSHIAEF